MNLLPITLEGATRLRKDLEHMVSKQRPEIVAAIAEARAHGDLKENAEYHAAREQQSFLEAKIAKIEVALANGNVIDVANLSKTGQVLFGSTVTIYNLAKLKENIYTLVGDIESDIEHNKISLSSPIATALIGKKKGDIVEIDAPSGKFEIEILAVD